MPSKLVGVRGKSIEEPKKLEAEIAWLERQIDRTDRNRGFFARDLIADWAIQVLLGAVRRREERIADLALNGAQRLLEGRSENG